MNETATAPRFPEVSVQLSDLNGNAFAAMCRVQEAMKQGCLSEREFWEFESEARGVTDFDHLTATARRWFDTT